MLLLVLPLAGAPRQAPADGSDADPGALRTQLIALATKRIRAFDEGDATTWQSLVDDSWMQIGIFGDVGDKQDAAAAFLPRAAGYDNDFHFEDVVVRRYGDVAIMTYRIIETENWDGQRVTTAPLRKTDIFALRRGHWLVVGTHESAEPVPPPRRTVGAALLRAYAGDYRLMRSLTYRIQAGNSGLTLIPSDTREPLRLFAESDTSFLIEGTGRRVIFAAGASGKVSRIIIRGDGYDLIAKRIP